MGTWVTESKIESLTTLTIDDTSIPNRTQVAQYITEAEARITDRALGSHTATDQYIDVPSGGGIAGRYQWVYYVKDDRLRTEISRGRIVPLQGIKAPIISISACAKNDQDPSNAASWTTLTEGPGDGSDYMLLTSGLKDLGYALWFYDNEPLIGPKRLKLTYTYGYNVDSDVLGDWGTYIVGIKVLQTRKNSGQIDGMSSYDGGDLGDYVPRHYMELIKSYRDSMREIEREHFSRRKDQAFEVV